MCARMCVLRAGFDDQIWVGGLLKLGNRGETKEVWLFLQFYFRMEMSEKFLGMKIMHAYCEKERQTLKKP